MNQEKMPSDKIALWVDEHGPGLFRHAFLRLGDRQLAEDLVQDTFLAAVEKIDTFRAESSPGTWLGAILRNKIADRLRSLHPERLISSSVADGDLDSYFNSCGAWRGWFFKHWSDCPHDVLENKGFATTLLSCLAKLPLRLRQVFMTRVMDQVSTEQVCAEYELTESNLGVILFRSRMHLRGCLEQHWFKPYRMGEKC